eukprot:SAG31_NODE_7428_length_1691_cov_1.145729_1_plen_104_part_00
MRSQSRAERASLPAATGATALTTVEHDGVAGNLKINASATHTTPAIPAAAQRAQEVMQTKPSGNNRETEDDPDDDDILIHDDQELVMLSDSSQSDDSDEVLIS